MLLTPDSLVSSTLLAPAAVAMDAVRCAFDAAQFNPEAFDSDDLHRACR